MRKAKAALPITDRSIVLKTDPHSINRQTMRILLINPDDYTDRLHWMESQFSRLGLTFERIPACKPEELSEDRIRQIHATCESGMVRKPIEIAANISHKRCWRIIADGNDPYVCVFEDDVHLSPDAAKFLSTSSWIPDGAELIKIETFNFEVAYFYKHPIAAFDRTLFRLKGFHPGAAGYIISRDAARMLLEKTKNNFGNNSFILFSDRPSRAARLVTYQLFPALCFQDMRIAGDKNPKLASVLGHKDVVNNPFDVQLLNQKAKERQARTKRSWSHVRREIKLRIAKMTEPPTRTDVIPFS